MEYGGFQKVQVDVSVKLKQVGGTKKSVTLILPAETICKARRHQAGGQGVTCFPLVPAWVKLKIGTATIATTYLANLGMILGRLGGGGSRDLVKKPCTYTSRIHLSTWTLSKGGFCMIKC